MACDFRQKIFSGFLVFSAIFWRWVRASIILCLCILQEDRMLFDAVTKQGNTFWRWKDISALIPGRTDKQCRARWKAHVDPVSPAARSKNLARITRPIRSLLRSKITIETSSFKQYGSFWLIFSRSQSIRKGQWTQAEDQVIICGVELMGHAWAEIARHMPGRSVFSLSFRSLIPNPWPKFCHRSDSAIKNRFVGSLERSIKGHNPMGEISPKLAFKKALQRLSQASKGRQQRDPTSPHRTSSTSLDSITTDLILERAKTNGFKVPPICLSPPSAGPSSHKTAKPYTYPSCAIVKETSKSGLPSFDSLWSEIISSDKTAETQGLTRPPLQMFTGCSVTTMRASPLSVSSTFQQQNQPGLPYSNTLMSSGIDYRMWF